MSHAKRSLRGNFVNDMLFFMPFNVILKLLERFRADDVLYAACVLYGCLFVNAESDEEAAEERVTLVHPFGYLEACFGKRDVAVVVHVDISVFAELFHGYADTRL